MAMAIIDLYGPPAGFMLLTAVLLLALGGVMYTRATARLAAAPA
jgi:hypothetical protein